MKQTPISKVYEALTAIVDNRVVLKDNTASVTSSDNEKTYQVNWKDNLYSSNDNATFWQGYPGYPVVAVLMLQGKIKYAEDILKYFKNVNWHALNEQYKKNYDEAILSFLSQYDDETIEFIKESVEYIYKQLLNLDIAIVRKI